MISIDKTAFPEHDVGSDIALKVKISCPSHCNLQCGQIRICDDTGAILKESMLTSFDGTANETDEFVVEAPIEPGEYTWSAAFVAQEKEGILHGKSSAPFSFITRPHATGMAVWDVHSPVTYNADFNLKIGVSCSSACGLAGQQVEIYNHLGTKIAECILGDLPWSETRALYWLEAPLKAPGKGEYCQWTVKFPKPDLELAHEGPAHAFAFGIAARPEHGITVKVMDSNGTPIENADVTLHSSGTPTESNGRCRHGKVERAQGRVPTLCL